MLKNAFYTLTKTALSAASSLSESLLIQQGERYLTIKDYPFGTEIHFSLPVYPQYPEDTESFLGLYLYIKVPFYVDLHMMIKESNGALTIENIPLYFDEVDLSALSSIPRHSLAMHIGSQFIELFKEVFRNKTEMVAHLLVSRFNIGGSGRFDTLKDVPGPFKDRKNDYLFLPDEQNHIFFINDVTGTNSTSAINNIERISNRFSPDIERGVAPFSARLLSMLFGTRPATQAKPRDMKVVIAFINIDHKSIVFLDQDFNFFAPGIKVDAIKPVWDPLISGILPIIFRH